MDVSHHHPPKQDRSRRTLERIESAALALIAEKGAEATTVHEVVRRARSSVGSFYARFPAKEDLLRHLEGKVWARARARFDAALEAHELEGASLSELLASLVRLVLESHREDLRQRRFLDLRTGAPDRGAGMRGFHAHILARVRPLILARAAEIRHPIPERAVDVGFAAVVGAIRVLEEGTLEAPAAAPARAPATATGVRSGPSAGPSAVSAPAPAPVPAPVPSAGPTDEGGRAGLSDEAVVDELARLYRRYLGGGAEAGEAPPQMEFFDIWG
ncbi:MAG: helix-turn-helix domain-containing protein [Longimicrobiales bacterium]|nr:helix-turn-helix domain-containing protein [Longimicrobiales bacterium]